MKLVTIQLFKKIPKNHEARKHLMINPKDIEGIIKILKNKTKIEVYDLTVSNKKQKLQIISVKDHINRTGINPLMTRQKELKINFLDSGEIYKKKSNGIITDCCGETLNKNYLFPSHYLSNISLLAKALQIKEFSAFLINVL